jgi:hypothetical protein
MDTLKLKPASFKSMLSVILASLVLAACATSTPKLDDHFGEAVNAAKAQQTLNPDASLNTDPVAGVDGEAANAAIDRYHKSFVQPPATTNVFNIGVGTNSGTGSGSSGTSR